MPPESRSALSVGIPAWVAPIPVAIVSGIVLLVSLPVTAQITPDNTLGSENSRVTGGVQVRGEVGDRIDGGAARGPNLFHSFSEFNVNDGQRVYFSNPTGIENILSRVTGSDVSDILGTLGVDGGANLFLLNPNGIVFGPNAQLDIRGSFVASTADSFTFADGNQFSASNPQAVPLLTMNAPIGLQYGAPQGDLTNQADLAVETSQTLTLHGATVLHEGELTAPGGRVQVLGDRIALLDNSRIDVSAEGGGGFVQVGGDYQGQGTLPTALRTYVAPTATIHADAIGAGHGGEVILWADESTGFWGTITARAGTESGNGGFVEVSGLQNLLFQGSADLSAPNGVVGTLLLDPTNIVIADGMGGLDDAQITADNVINSDDDALLDYTISEAALEGLLGGANVILQASNNITIDDLTDNELTFNPGGGRIQFVANADGVGGGDFTMNAADTIRTNGRSISISGVNLTLGTIDTTPPASLPVITTLNVDNGGIIGAISQELQSPSVFTFTVPLTTTTATISDVNVIFSASHTWNEDLGVTLQSPNGQTLELFNFVGGSGDNFQDTVLDDAAPNSIANVSVATAPFNGSYQPTGAGGLTIFNGSTLTPNSVWRLGVTDTFPLADSGQLYQAGEPTVWGAPALGTQLVITTSVANVASGGDIALTGTGNVSAQQLNASSFSLGGGEVVVNAGGDINILNINTDGFNGTGGAVRLRARTPNVPSVAGNINVQRISAFGGNGNGGLVSLDARGAINNFNNTIDINASSSTGLGGDITLNADGPLILDSRFALDSSFISSTSNSPGLGSSTILLTSTAGDISLRNTQIDASNSAPGDNGNNTGRAGIVINTPGNVAIEDSGLYAYGIGTIDIQGGETVNLANSYLSTETGFAVDGDQPRNGAIALRTTAPNSTLTLTDTQLTSSTDGADDSGNISLTSSRINLTRSQVTTTSVVVFGADEQLVTGNVGSIAIDGALTLNGSLLDSSTEGSGVGGTITLEGPLRLINGSAINANTTGNGGLGGNIDIRAEGTQVSLANSQINLIAGRDTRAGTLTVQAGAVSLTDGSRINATVQGSGTGGNINITTTDPYNPATHRFPFHLDNSLISTRVESTGTAAGGDVRVNSAAIALRNGARIEADTLGTGRAGSIRLNATERVEISGIDSTTGLFSGLTTESQSETSGEGGNIFVRVQNSANTGTLVLSDRAFLSSGTASSNPGGDINIDVNRLVLRRGGQILASSTGTGAAGSITVNADQQVLLDGQGRPIQLNTPDAPDAFTGISLVPLAGAAIATGLQSPVSNNPFYANVARPNDQPSAFDYYTFSITQANSRGIFDIDAANFDTELFLFNRATGQVLAGNDDADTSLGEGGSTSFLDSYIDYTFASPGEYVIGVGQYDSEAATAQILGAAPPDRSTYNLRVSLENQGAVRFNAEDLNPNNGLSSGLLAETSGQGAAGQISVTTPSFTVQNTARVSTTTSSQTPRAGAGGNIDVATQFLTLRGTDLVQDDIDQDSSTGLLAQTTGRGTAGTITLRPLQEDTSLTITLSGSAQVSASTTGLGEGGDLVIGSLTANADPLANGVTIQGDGQIQAGSTGRRGSQAAGSVFIGARDEVVIQEAAQVSVSGRRGAGSGTLTVAADAITLRDRAQLSANTQQGVGGNITLADADTLTIWESEVSASTEQGSAGDVTIEMQRGGDVNLSNAEIASASTQGGLAGDLSITGVDRLTLDHSNLSVQNRGRGQSGSLNIEARQARLNNSALLAGSTNGPGGDLNVQVRNTLSLDGGSRISASTEGGQGGSLDLRAGQLTLNGESSITASATAPSGRGGDLELTVRDELSLDGRSSLGSQATNGGTAGNVTLTSERLRIRNGSEVSVSSEEGVAGNLTVNTTRLRMDNGRLTALAGQGSNGSITINVLADSNALIELYDNSLISAEARGSADGGDVTIRIPNGFVVSTLEDNSDIIARANGEGSGGDIFIRTLSIFGLQTGDRLTRFSDINASSEFGPTGTIVLSTLGIDPTRGLAELPNTIVDATSLVARSCSTQLEASESLGFFIITGRGGLPQTPGDMLSESVLLPGLISLNPAANEADIQLPTDANAAHATIVEAQGWAVGPDGNVILTAQQPGENALPGVRSLTCEDGV